MMNQRQKLKWLVIFLASGMALYLLFSLVLRMKGIGLPHGSFLFYKRNNHWMDFFSINSIVYGGNPYEQNHSPYPPFALALSYPFIFITGGDFNSRDYSAVRGVLSYFVLFSSGTAALLTIFIKRLSMNGSVPIWLAIAGSLAIVFSAPYLYLLDRGNYLILALIAYLLFLLTYRNKKYLLAALYLAVAICIKIYPAVFLLLFLKDRKWRSLFLAIVLCAVFTLVPLFFFDGGPVHNLKYFIISLFSFNSGYANPVMNTYYSVGISSLFNTPAVIHTAGFNSPIFLKISTVVNVLLMGLSVGVILRILKENSLFMQSLILTLLMILFPKMSYDYNLVYLFGPLMLFLLEKEPSVEDRWHLAFFAFALIPKAYYYWILAGTPVGVQSIIDPLVLLVWFSALVLFGRLPPIMRRTAIQ